MTLYSELKASHSRPPESRSGWRRAPPDLPQMRIEIQTAIASAKTEANIRGENYAELALQDLGDATVEIV